MLDLRTLAGAAAGAAGTATTIGELQDLLGLKDVTLFVSAPNSLPAGAGLALYVATVNSPAEATSPAWQYRGCVAEGKPSDAFPLSFPSSGSEGGGGGGQDGREASSTPTSSFSLLPLSLVPATTAAAAAAAFPTPSTTSLVVGVSLEPAADLTSRESSSVASRLEFGRRVGLDLFRFAQSFAPVSDPVAAAAGAAVLPPGALDAWWRKFEAKFRRDPEFLLRRQEE